MAFLDTSQLEKDIKGAGKFIEGKFHAIGQRVAAVGATITGVGTAVVGALGAATTGFVQTGDALDKMNQRTGVSVEALSTLTFAAEQSGSGMETLENGIKGMQRNLLDAERGLSTANDNLADLGLTLSDLKGLSPEEQFKVFADRIAEVEDPSRRAALAMKVFGRAGQDLVPLLSGGAAGIEALQQQARDANLEFSTDDAKTAARLADAWNLVQKQFKRVSDIVGAAVAPVISDVLDTVSEFVPKVIQWTKENKGLIVGVGKLAVGLVAAGGSITAIGVGIAGAGTVIATLASGVAFLVSPVGLIVAGLGSAAGAALYFSGALETVSGVISSILEALGGGNFARAGQIAMTALQLAFFTGAAALADGFDTAVRGILSFFGVETKHMGSLWDGFVKGIVTTFTSASRKVVDVWKNAVTSISNFLLDQAAQGGITGSIVSQVLGVDIDAQQAKDEFANLAELRQKEKQLSTIDGEITEARAEGDEVGAKTLEKIKGELENRVAELKNTTVDALRDLKAASKENIDSQATGITSVLDSIDKAVADGRLSSSGLKSTRDDLAKRLKELQEAKAAIDEESPGLGASGGTLAGRITDPLDSRLTIRGGFGSNVAALAAAGGSRDDPQLSELISKTEAGNATMQQIRDSLTPD